MNHPNIEDARTPGRASLVRRARVTRRARRGAALSIATVGALILGLFLGVPAAYADDYPTWDDVQAAKANEATAASEVTRIQGLIASLTQNVATTKAASEAAGNEYFTAQQALDEQARRLSDLQGQVDAQQKVADSTASKAGQIAAQLSRDGGDTTALQLFFSKSTTNTDELLQRLGQMDRVLSGTQAIYDKALEAKNTAQALSDQAAKAKTERDRLAKIAEEKMQKAQEAADAAAAALSDGQTHLGQLQAQLAALQDTTAQTVAQYQAGEAARAAAEAARQAQLAAERQAAIDAARQNAANGGGGNGGGGGGGAVDGGGNSGGGSVGSGGWVRPFGGYQSSGYGPRVPDCDYWGCSSSFHAGVDLADGSCGSPIYAGHSGTVVYAGWNGGYGNYIKIDNGDGSGLATGYGHILDGGFNVGSGQWVNAGDVIAFAGNTGGSFGCHLHYEVYQWGSTINPINFMENQGVYMG